MDAETRQPDPPVIHKLLEEGHRFSFFRAVQLLHLCHPEAAPIGRTGPAREEAVRLRADLSFAVPRSTGSAIRASPGEDDGRPRYAVVQSLMGLFGIRSPMPEVYTEELLQRALESDPVRDLLDLFHHRILSLLYRAWARSRPHVTFRTDPAETLTQIVFCIAALGEEPLRRAASSRPLGLIRYAPFLARSAKTGPGLEAILSDFLDGAPVRVEPHALRRVTIPEDQRARLGEAGCRLGEDFSLGETIQDRAGKFRLVIGPLARPAFQALSPGGAARDGAGALVRLYVLDALEHDVVLGILAGEKPAFRLGAGEDGPRLGIDTWLSSDRLEDSWIPFPSFPRHPREGAEELVA